MATVRKDRGNWVADFRDQNGRRHIEVPEGYFATKALQKLAARNLLQKRLDEVGANAFIPLRERMTFEELAKAWLKSKVRIGDTTQSDYEIMLNCFVLPYFGPRKAEHVTLLDFEKFRSDMSEGLPEVCRSARAAKLETLRAQDPAARLKALKDPGVRTINKCLGVIISICRYGDKTRILSGNVAKGLEKLPTTEGEDRCIEKNVLTPFELSFAIQHALDPYRIPIAIGAYTGMREEEILGFKWTDFSADYSTAEVKRVYRRGRFAMPKTAASLRTVEIPRALQMMLREWRNLCPQSEHNLICPSVTGRPMQASALLQRGFVPALVRAGIRRVRFHDLRHSFASNLLQDGVDVVTVSKALGHANVQITLVTYAHAIPKPRHGATDRMATLIGQSGNKMETLPGAPTEAGTAKAA